MWDRVYGTFPTPQKNSNSDLDTHALAVLNTITLVTPSIWRIVCMALVPPPIKILVLIVLPMLESC